MIVTDMQHHEIEPVWVEPRLWPNETGVMASRERLLTYRTVMSVRIAERDRPGTRVREMAGPPVATVDVCSAYDPMVVRTELWQILGVATIIGVKLVTDEWEVIGECVIQVSVKGSKVLGFVFERRRGGDLRCRLLRAGGKQADGRRGEWS